MKANFVKTDDEDMAHLLIEHGFELFKKTNKEWVFINNKILNYSDNNEKDKIKKKLVYTNVLMM